MRVLVIDSAEQSRSLVPELAREGYAVDTAGDGELGLRSARTGIYDLIILERALDKLDGLELVRTLRNEANETPIMFLSKHADVRSKIEGLRAGADDYVAKPAPWDELLARVVAVIRRR